MFILKYPWGGGLIKRRCEEEEAAAVIMVKPPHWLDAAAASETSPEDKNIKIPFKLQRTGSVPGQVLSEGGDVTGEAGAGAWFSQTSASQHQHKHVRRELFGGFRKKVPAAFRRGTFNRTTSQRPRRLIRARTAKRNDEIMQDRLEFIVISDCGLPLDPHSPPSSISVRRRAEGLSHDWDAQRGCVNAHRAIVVSSRAHLRIGKKKYIHLSIQRSQS